MVLHHVAHGTGLVIIAAAPAHTHGFGHGDLHTVDMLGVPQRLEQDIGKAHRHKVLDGFLAQIMVDPVDLAFFEMRGQHGVQHLGRGEVTPERLLYHDAAVLGGDPMLVQAFCQVSEQRRGDREIEGTVHTGAHFRLQVRPAAGSRRINRDIADARQKLVDLGGIAFVGADKFLDCGAHLGLKLGRCHGGSGGPDDAAVSRDLACPEPPVQPRQYLAPRQVARSPEDDKVEGVDRDDARYHVISREQLPYPGC